MKNKICKYGLRSVPAVKSYGKDDLVAVISIFIPKSNFQKLISRKKIKKVAKILGCDVVTAQVLSITTGDQVRDRSIGGR